MRYLLDEEEFRALPTKTEIDELEQRIRECDVLIKLLRDKILTMTNTVCIHVSQQDVSYFCNNCPLSQKQNGWKEPRLCDLKQRYST